MTFDDAYVKQSFSLSWGFFKDNQTASLLSIVLLLVLALASTLAGIGVFVLLLLAILSFSIQVYVAKSLNTQEREANVSDLLFKHINIALGTFLGQLTIELLLGGVFFLVFASLVGMDVYEALKAGTLAQNQIYPVYMKIGFIAAIAFLIIMLWVYFVPMMLAYAYEAESLKEAFLAAFVLFSAAVWKASFKERYYVLISMLQVTGMLLFSSIALILSNVYLLPLAMFLLYMFLVYLAITSRMAKVSVV